jgi:hypothetical protein
MSRIDQRDITHQGRKLTVTVDRDDDGDPRTDGDCYTPEDVAAWQCDEWQYVTVGIMDGSEIIDSLSGVEFGYFGTRDLDMDYMIETHPVPDMLTSIPVTVPVGNVPTWTYCYVVTRHGIPTAVRWELTVAMAEIPGHHLDTTNIRQLSDRSWVAEYVDSDDFAWRIRRMDIPPRGYTKEV